jgi:peptidoglycan-N-acetylglucosamine deacetylase
MFIVFALVAAGIVALSHTAPFPFLLDWMSGGRAMWRMPSHPPDRTVYLTFDDGPNPEATPALLDTLKQHDAKATFFLIDRHITEETAPIVRRMFDEGHGVAQHTHTRALMFMAPDRLALTLTGAADRIEALTGRRPCRAFRPHAGWRSGTMLSGLDRIDYQLVGWGWMLWDWDFFRKRDAERLMRKIVSRASPGDIVVIHDGHHENPRAERSYAWQATAGIVPALRARGFSFGAICP